MSKISSKILLLSALSMAACAANDPAANEFTKGPVASDTSTYELPTPIIQELAPTYVAAGDVITAYGTGFVPKRYGTTLVRLKGKFTTTSGATQNVDYEIEAEYVNSGKVTFVFDPISEGSFKKTKAAGDNNEQNSFGMEMGSFNGYAWAINRNTSGDIKEQEEEPAKFDVVTKPSVIVDAIYPMKQSCQTKVLKRSVEGTNIGMNVNIVGLETPSIINPITVSIIYRTFDEAAQAPCPLSQLDLPGCSIGDEDGVHIETRTITDPDQLTFTLKDIDFGLINEDVLSNDGMVSINASDGKNSISRIINVTMYKAPYVVEYDGSYQIAEIYAPELVSDCIPGGLTGASVSYSENHSESHSRSCGINASAGLKIPKLEKILSLGFGMNISASVSSSNGASLGINRQILANQYGAVYRQTQRLLRSADIVEYNACGIKKVIGEANLTDWSWTPDIAMTTNYACPPVPESNLHPAECFINCD